MASYASIVDYLEHHGVTPGDMPVRVEIFDFLLGRIPTIAFTIARSINPAANPHWTVELPATYSVADISPHLDALAALEVLHLSVSHLGMVSIEYWSIHEKVKDLVAPFAEDSASESDCITISEDLKTPEGDRVLRHPSVVGHILFNSEHPECEGFFMSNWYNNRYHDPDSYYWCAEQHFLVKKLTFCANRTLACNVLAAVLAIEPVPAPAYGAPGFQEAWDTNHEKARAMKALCRDRSLDLLVDVWNSNKYDILVGVLRSKFDLFYHPMVAEQLLHTLPASIAEANPDDVEFSIGLQPGVHRPRNKLKHANKSALVLVGCVERWRVPPSEWKGKNLLGKALMEVRSALTAPDWRFEQVCSDSS